jgi:SAM-dependent methyltransferase
MGFFCERCSQYIKPVNFVVIPLRRIVVQREAYFEMYHHEDHHWWFISRRMIVQKVLDRCLSDGNTRSILEVGCGTGGNFELLSKYGDLRALEQDDDARDMANRRGLCLVAKGFLPDNIPFSETFDLICMLDVLEHIDDDLKTLQEISKRLNSNGKLLLTVPAYEFLWSEHDITLAHKRRYRKKQLIQLVKRAGLDSVYSTYFNTFLFPVIAVTRFLNKALGKKGGTDVNMPSNFRNVLLTKIFSSEKLLIPRISLPFGVSILLVAKKSMKV